jgi:hypothetical protein
VLAAAATEDACVNCVAALTRTITVPVKPDKPEMVTTVLLTLVNDVPTAAKATASAP